MCEKVRVGIILTTSSPLSSTRKIPVTKMQVAGILFLCYHTCILQSWSSIFKVTLLER